MASPGHGYQTANATVSAFSAIPIVPSDVTVLTNTRALYVGTGGNLAVTTFNGEVITFTNVNGGTIMPLQVTKVMATNTTALGVIGLY